MLSHQAMQWNMIPSCAMFMIGESSIALIMSYLTPCRQYQLSAIESTSHASTDSETKAQMQTYLDAVLCSGFPQLNTQHYKGTLAKPSTTQFCNEMCNTYTTGSNMKATGPYLELATPYDISKSTVQVLVSATSQGNFSLMLLLVI